MTSIHTWSKTASENDDADSGINWVEGQDPDTVNNSARAVMGRVAEWRDDISIARATTGAADVYEVTMGSSPVALVDGMMFMIKPHQTNVGASTLKVNSFGAKPLRAKTSTNLSGGDVQINVPALVSYNQAADEFLLINSGFFANALFPSLVSTYALNSLIPVGAVLPYPHDTVPAGWLEANGQSLQTAAYPELFTKYAYKYGGSGSNFNIPDYRGEFLRGYDGGAGNDPDAASRSDRGDGTSGDSVGSKQGQNTGVHGHTASSSTSVSVANGGAHTHQQTNTGYDQDYGTASPTHTSGTPASSGPVASSAYTLSGGTHNHSATGSTSTTVSNSTGSESRGRNVSVMFIIFAKPAAALAEMQGLTGLPYVFDDGVTAVDPGSGKLSWNNVNAGSATELYVNETGPNSEPFGPILSAWDDLGSTTRGYLYITKVGTPTTFTYFAIESVETDNGTWKQWTIAAVGSNGTFADGDNLNVIFTPVGTGATGAIGPTGAAGVSGGLYYAFDSSTTTNADPGTGDVRLNDAAFVDVTEIAISYSGADTGAPDFETLIKTWDDSTTLTNRGQILLKKSSAVENFAAYRITAAITDGTTYGRFTVVHDDSSGSFSDTDDIRVEFTRTGDTGATGPGSGDLLASNNLSDVGSAAAALSNIGAAAASHVHPASDITSGTLAHERGGLELDVSGFSGLVRIAGGVTSAVSDASEAEMQTGTESALRGMSPLRVAQAVSAAVPSAGPSAGQGRLTLTSGTPVLTADVAAAGTVYYTPYLGLHIPIYNGTAIIMTSTGGELSNVLADSSTGKAGPAATTANNNYDLFVWDDSGTIRLTRGPEWSGDASRSAGTALVRTSGFYLNSVDITNGPAASRGTYVGTVRTTGGATTIDYKLGSAASGGGAAYVSVWNMFNRVRVGCIVNDTDNSWTYSTVAWRPMNNSTDNRISALQGLREDTVLGHLIMWAGATFDATGCAAIGIGSTTARATNSNAATVTYTGGTITQQIPAFATGSWLGWSYLQALESPNKAFTIPFYGDAGQPIPQSGFRAEVIA